MSEGGHILSLMGHQRRVRLEDPWTYLPTFDVKAINIPFFGSVLFISALPSLTPSSPYFQNDGIPSNPNEKR